MYFVKKSPMVKVTAGEIIREISCNIREISHKIYTDIH